MRRRPPISPSNYTRVPSTTLFRSDRKRSEVVSFVLGVGRGAAAFDEVSVRHFLSPSIRLWTLSGCRGAAVRNDAKAYPRIVHRRPGTRLPLLHRRLVAGKGAVALLLEVGAVELSVGIAAADDPPQRRFLGRHRRIPTLGFRTFLSHG